MAMDTVLEGRRMVAGGPPVSVNGLAGVTASTSSVMLRVVVRNMAAARQPLVARMRRGAHHQAHPVVHARPPRCVVATVPVQTAPSASPRRSRPTSRVGSDGAARSLRRPRCGRQPGAAPLGAVGAGSTKSLTPLQLGQPTGAQAVQVTITLRRPRVRAASASGRAVARRGSSPSPAAADADLHGRRAHQWRGSCV